MATMTMVVASTKGTPGLTSCFLDSNARHELRFSTSCAPMSSPLRQYPSVRCGRGDKRTAKGKIFKGSFGNSRPKDKSKGRGLGTTPLPPRPPKKEYDDSDFIQVDLDESLFSG